MPILECGFLAGGVDDPTSSKDIFSAAPVVVGGPQGASLTVPFQGGWGFALAATSQGRLYSWGVNQATVLGKQGAWEADLCQASTVPAPQVLQMILGLA